MTASGDIDIRVKTSGSGITDTFGNVSSLSSES
jgi:hypothetical protein